MMRNKDETGPGPVLAVDETAIRGRIVLGETFMDDVRRWWSGLFERELMIEVPAQPPPQSERDEATRKDDG